MPLNLSSFILGICIGSFINVIVYRFPLNKSVIQPRSFCPSCKNKILPINNIPILSWIFLRGKCKFCKTRISIEYPLVELLTGILFLIFSYSDSTKYLYIEQNIFIVFTWILITLFLPLVILDYKYFWLPNALTNLLSIVVIAFLSIYSLITVNENGLVIFFSHLGTALSIFIIFRLIMFSGYLIYGKKIMGDGDTKLIFILGILLGPSGILIALFLTFNLAGLTCFILLSCKKLKKGDVIPLGPYIIFSGMSVWLFGDNFFLEIYDHLIGFTS